MNLKSGKGCVGQDVLSIWWISQEILEISEAVESLESFHRVEKQEDFDQFLEILEMPSRTERYVR